MAIGGTAVFDTFTLRRLSTRDSFWYSSYYYISGLLPVNSADDVVYFKLFFCIHLKKTDFTFFIFTGRAKPLTTICKNRQERDTTRRVTCCYF